MSATHCSAQALNPFTRGDKRGPDGARVTGDRARIARDEGEVEGEVLDLPPLTSENDEECSGVRFEFTT